MQCFFRFIQLLHTNQVYIGELHLIRAITVRAQSPAAAGGPIRPKSGDDREAIDGCQGSYRGVRTLKPKSERARML